MEQIKIFFKVLAALGILSAATYASIYYIGVKDIPFESVCTQGHEKYTNLCQNIGKRAYATKRMSALNNRDYGKIVGVSWRERGGRISPPGQEIRHSDSNSYYYIISSGSDGYYFLRITSEIDPR